MNSYIKKFLHRGLIFSGFGPVVVGIVYFIISMFTEVSVSGGEMLIAIVSGYFLAFIQGGASIFNQIDSLSPAKSLFCHMGTLYLAYTACYLINTWIPFDPVIIAIYTAIFIIIYLTIWLIVYFTVKVTAMKMQANISQRA